jgi:HAD superfamily hydrolase (TIGR01484 family)
MRYLALATDYDGTLATEGKVDDATLAALERLRASGRKLILVTGRELEDLRRVFPRLDLFDSVVAENGGVLFDPATKRETALADAPPPRFAETLRERGVNPLSVGKVIVATWEPHQTTAVDAIRDLGLELQVIFNKGAVMVLPAGVNKASGLAAALDVLGLSVRSVVGVGDAENDHAFLKTCERSAAVANALPAVKETADIVTPSPRGAGVVELIDALLADDLATFAGRPVAEPERERLVLGSRDDGSDAWLPPYGGGVLVAGPSGSGKSTAATALMDRLAGRGYRFCVIDPEGDYSSLEDAVVLGDPKTPPTLDGVLQVLKSPDRNVAVNLVGLPLADRPAFFHALLPRLLEMRLKTGRPHWLFFDEAHHLLPESWKPADTAVPLELDRFVLVTVHPDTVAPAVLGKVDTLLAIGDAPGDTAALFCRAVGRPAPEVPFDSLDKGEVMLWRCGAKGGGGEEPPARVKLAPGRMEHRRHVRKYAEGELPPDRSFYFRGPEGKLNLRAQNLILFAQIADGVDDGTWLHHLRAGDVSTWIRTAIKDRELADAIGEIEGRDDLSPADSRAAVREAIEREYTLPA